MNGAESLMRTARQADVEVCFANPGTTEMELVAALDAVSGIRAVARGCRAPSAPRSPAPTAR